MNKEADKNGEKERRFNYLKRMKNRLEFRISTEASSLSKEKEIIRQIGEINQELDELAVSVKMERKLGLVKGDIEECIKRLSELEPKVVGIDANLDKLYSELRQKLGIIKQAPQFQSQRPSRLREREPKIQQSQEINLSDIAVIKKKDSK